MGCGADCRTLGATNSPPSVLLVNSSRKARSVTVQMLQTRTAVPWLTLPTDGEDITEPVVVSTSLALQHGDSEGANVGGAECLSPGR